MLTYYKYKSDTLQSDCIICFEDGIFKSFEVENPQPPISEVGRFPLWKKEDYFLADVKAAKVTITKIDREITFEMFYEKFDNKVGKVEAKKAWDKLTKVEKQQAYDFIPSYLNHKKLTGALSQYPASYLNSKRFIK